MAVATENSFRVDRPVGEVWDFLVDPECVVGCIPGARIVGEIDEHEYEGEIRVGFGFVNLTFRGTLRYDELDPEALRARFTGSGRARGGWGSVRFEAASRLRAEGEARTRVGVRHTVEVDGRMARFGGGRLVQELADFLFGRFAACVRAKLEAEE